MDKIIQESIKNMKSDKVHKICSELIDDGYTIDQVLAFLEDGEAMDAMGITDKDQEDVEGEIDQLRRTRLERY